MEGRGVSGLRSGVDVISDARAAAAQHKQWRAQQTGGGIASRQQLHTRTNGGNGRARVHSSCSSGGGGGSNSSHRLPLHWRRRAAHTASRLAPVDWAHAPRGASGDLIRSNPPQAAPPKGRTAPRFLLSAVFPNEVAPNFIDRIGMRKLALLLLLAAAAAIAAAVTPSGGPYFPGFHPRMHTSHNNDVNG